MSLSLPIAEHVLGARASRTTHPRFLADCDRLFSLLLSERFGLENPYLWKTKREVVLALAEHGAAHLIDKSFSCTRVRESTRTGKHCGACSQCIDRRFAVLAAGLAAYEPADAYSLDLFKGEHTPGASLTMIESYVARAQKLATMSEPSFLAAFGQVFRALPYLVDPPDEGARKIYDLHHRHGREVVGVIDDELRANATLIQTLTLPSTSLLAMIIAPMAEGEFYGDPIEEEEPSSVQAAKDSATYARVPIVFAVDGQTKRVLFRGGPPLTGSAYHVVSELLKEFVEDIEKGIPKSSFRFVKPRSLAERLGVQEHTLRQRVTRMRRVLDEGFTSAMGMPLDIDDIIENHPWRGYRLNPYLLLVQPNQLGDLTPGNMSRTSEPNVTARPPESEPD